jgi:hypothetical protein
MREAFKLLCVCREDSHGRYGEKEKNINMERKKERTKGGREKEQIEKKKKKKMEKEKKENGNELVGVDNSPAYLLPTYTSIAGK